MGIPVLILGESGTGKSAAMRNMDPETTLLVQSVRKPLPFKANGWEPWSNETKTGSIVVTDNWEALLQIASVAPNYGKTQIIFDDFQYLLANEFMRRSHEKGFEKFTDIGRHAWEVMMAAQASPSDSRFYFLMHTSVDEAGTTRAKTIGRLLDDKITVEGLFSIVFKTVVTDQGYFFSTKNSGSDTVKTPMGLFEDSRIENDLKSIDANICSYYNLTK